MSVLAIQPGALGDFVLSLPALRALRATLGAERMEIWAERANLSLVDQPAYTTSIRALADTGFDSYPLPARTVDLLRTFDHVFSWRGAALAELVEAVRAVHPRAYFLEQFPSPGKEVIHQCDFRRAQLSRILGDARLGAIPTAWQPEVVFDAADHEFARDFLAAELAGGGPLAVVHPGASGESKRWASGNFVAVIGHLVAAYQANVLVTEGPLDAAAVGQVSAAVDRPLRRIVIDDVRRLATVLRHVDLFVGNDTGVAHLAAAAGTPVIAIFVATDPRQWAPRGRAVQTLVRPELSEVLRAADSILNRR